MGRVRRREPKHHAVVITNSFRFIATTWFRSPFHHFSILGDNTDMYMDLYSMVLEFKKFSGYRKA
jgi:hypothetical protein